MKCKTLLLLMMLAAVSSLLSAQGLKVEPGTCIKVESVTMLDISGGGNLILKSDATGDASLIDKGTVSYAGVPTAGKAIVERYLPQGQWHLISSPISNAVSGMFIGDYLQYHTESSNSYTDIIPVNIPLKPAQGYSLWSVLPVASTEVFGGSTNTGDIGFDFTKTNEGYGWNLVGNPYPSVLDWDAVTIPTNLNGSIWLFSPSYDDRNGAKGSIGEYKYYLNGGGSANTTTQYIPSGQGFFVRAATEATVGGTLTFKNEHRVHNSFQPFYKAADAENRMLVLKATGNNITTQTAIRFKEEATAQVDRLYDVYKITAGSPEVPVVYTKCENQKMAINTLPSIAGNSTVPVYFEAGMNGTYTYTATELETLGDEIPVYLEDIALNYFQDLRANPNYSFEYTSGNVKGFNIHFKSANGIEKFEKLNVICYLSNKVLHVNFPENEFGKAVISVYNITGQQILSRQTSLVNNEIAFNASQSVYIVNIVTNKGVFSTKVINQ